MSQDRKDEQRTQDSAIDRKKARVLEKESGWKSKAIIIAGAALALLGGWIAYQTLVPKNGNAGNMHAPGAGERVPAKAVTAQNGTIRIALADVTDGTAHYYAYQSGGKEVRFFLLKAADGTIRAALDACTACYRAKMGYSPKGDTMICNNCGMTFRSTDVGVLSGGCNPIPISKTVEGASVLIPTKDLDAGVKYF
jgi:hypothetical protein